MDTKTAEATLEDYLIHGIASDIFFADEAKSLCVEVGNHAEKVNAEGFGQLFGSIQAAYSDRQTLAVAKMFDPKDRNYPTRSIPAVLSLLEEYALLWSLPEKTALQNRLASAGLGEPTISAMNNEQLSLAVAAHFRSTLPRTNGTDSLSLALGKIRQARNKSIAHNEAIAQSARTLPTWGEAESLVNYAKDVVTTMMFGFLSATMGHRGSYYATADADRTSIALTRLLKAADLTA